MKRKARSILEILTLGKNGSAALQSFRQTRVEDIMRQQRKANVKATASKKVKKRRRCSWPCQLISLHKHTARCNRCFTINGTNIKHIRLAIFTATTVTKSSRVISGSQTFPASIIPSQWAWRPRHYVPPTCWYLPTIPHGVTTRNTSDIWSNIRAFLNFQRITKIGYGK